MIQHEVQRLDKMWKAEAIATRDAHKRRVLAEIDDCYREAVAAWDRSKLDAVRKSIESGAEGKGKKRVQSEGQCGDPRFLVEMRELRDQKIKLLGLDEPTSIDVSVPESERKKETERRINEIFGIPSRPAIMANGESHNGNGSPVSNGQDSDAKEAME